MTKHKPQNIVLQATVGSRLYRLDTPASDVDTRGIFVVPTSDVFRINKYVEEIQIDGQDTVYWEIEKFLKLAGNGNPNILDLLFSDVDIDAYSQFGSELLTNNRKFLSKKIFQTFGGYAQGQLKKFEKSLCDDTVPDWKNAMHLVRLYLMGIDCLQSGNLEPNMSYLGQRELLLEIRSGVWELKWLMDLVASLEGDLQEAYKLTNLPDDADWEWIDNFLERIRRAYL